MRSPIGRNSVFVLLLAAFVATGALAEGPTPSGLDLYDLLSSSTMSGGINAVDPGAPSQSRVNPALNGFAQRSAVAASYAALTDFSGAIDGHAISVGGLLARPAGVWAFSGQFYTAAAANLDIGTLGLAHLAFAKDLYPRLSVGAGFGIAFGSNGGFDFGVAADLGFVHLLGDIGPLRDLRWGFAVQNLGKGFTPADAPSHPAGFTPVLSTAFSPIQRDAVDLRLNLGLSLPRFTSIRFDAGARLTLFDVVGITAGWRVGADFVDSTRPVRSSIPSFGIDASISLGGKREPTAGATVDIEASAQPLYGPLWAIGGGVEVGFGLPDRFPPRVELGISEVVYLSPNNDGAFDTVDVPLTISDERYLAGYELLVKDQSGEVVRTIRNPREADELRTVEAILARVPARDASIPVPTEIRFDGRDEAGVALPDGEYTLLVAAADDNGNRGESTTVPVVIDRTPPTAEVGRLSDDRLIFSPNGDGNKDEIVVPQTGSREDAWTMVVRDTAGNAVRTEEQSGELGDFTWNGRNDENVVVADGVYRYEVRSVDRAGNVTESALPNIIVDTNVPPIELAIAVANVAPGVRGANDEQIFSPSVPTLGGVVSWSLAIENEAGSVVREFVSTDVVPTDIAYDGTYENGEVLAEGNYRGRLHVTYRNGTTPTVASPWFEIDVTPPAARTSVEYPVFSPNGDRRRDTIRLYHDTTPEQSWIGSIRNEAGEVVRSFAWELQPPIAVEWSGALDDGSPAPDGRYTYELEARDPAGNVGRSNLQVFTVDTAPTPVVVHVNQRAFSPNGDGRRDTMSILPRLDQQEGVQRYEIQIIRRDGDEETVVKRINGRGLPEGEYRWDGYTTDGTLAPDGAYFLRLSVDYENGNQPSAQGGSFLIDTAPPEVTELDIPDGLFSPDGDGNKDAITIVQSSTPETTWVGRIIEARSDGQVVREFSWLPSVDELVWDGTDAEGNVVPDGDYYYEIVGEDIASNRVERRLTGIRIDTREVEARIFMAGTIFSPNGDGVQETLQLQPVSTIPDGVDSWRLTVETRTGTAVRTYTGEGALPTELSWDGRDDTGAVVLDGSYRATLEVTYEKGNVATAGTPRAITVDTVAPTAQVATNRTILSPNGDGRLDDVEFSIDASFEQTWRGEIQIDGRVVRTYDWRFRPDARLSWNGTTAAGLTVPDGTYELVLTSTDTAGNTGTSQPVSFLVDTRRTPISVGLNRTVFSPNADRVSDSLTFVRTVSHRDRVTGYEWTIRDERGEARYSAAGDAAPPSRFVWNGRDDLDLPLPDGAYTAELEVEYVHGNNPSVRTEPFVIDTLPPTVRASADKNLFSPDGDGYRDSIRISQYSSIEPEWSAGVFSADGALVRRYTWTDRLTSIEWDGTDDAGNVVPDGIYSYQARGEDAAGNVSVAEIPNLRVDTRDTRLFVTVSRDAISPNGDGVADDLTLTLYTRIVEGLNSWKLEVLNGAGDVVRTFRGGSIESTQSIEWDGADARGITVRDGVYTARYSATYEKGNRPEVVSTPFRVDNTPPRLSVQLANLPFSPDNDGFNDELIIRFDVRDESAIADWDFQILDRTEQLFNRLDGTGIPAAEVAWNGWSIDGELVISAEDYPYVFTASDVLGNTAEIRGEIPIDILVIPDGDVLRIQISSIIFEPDSPVLVLDPDTEEGDRNRRVLGRLAEVLAKYDTYDIILEGHAVNVTGTQREQVEELVPLSLARAEAVEAALVERGIVDDRMETVGRGGLFPIVPHTDLQNRWKNRRVEFILLR